MKSENPTIQIRGESIELQPLTWKACLALVKRLTKAITSTLDSKNEFKLNPENLATSILETEGAVEFLVAEATGRETAWIESLSAREVMPLVGEIIAQNFDREFAESAKRIAGNITNIFVPAPKK